MTLPNTTTPPTNTTKRRRRPTTTNTTPPAGTLPITPAPNRIANTTLDPDEHQQISHEILDTLKDTGATLDEIRSIARAWEVTITELNTWEAHLQAANPTETNQIEANIAKLAAGMERAIHNRGRVTTPAILEATPEQLTDWIEYYDHELDQIYPTLATLTSSELLEARNEFDRLAGYLWECKTQSGIGDVLTAKGGKK